MRTIGYSTSALPFLDLHQAVSVLSTKPGNAIELSALRKNDLPYLVDLSGTLDLSKYEHISVHAPGVFSESEELEIVNLLKRFIQYEWPIIVHPEAIHRFERWEGFGELLCIENMDTRRPICRTADELGLIFDRLPEASFCFDLAHARQVDSSMMEAARILEALKDRLREIHIGEVNASSTYTHISEDAMRALKAVAHLIPPAVPAIIETIVDEANLEEQLERTLDSLTPALSNHIQPV